VLLKDDRVLLPLKRDIRKLAIIGPNAKQSFLSGGGSARLVKTYSVSPFEGISAVTPAEITHAVGAHTQKYVPLIERHMLHDGRRGALVEFWNDLPLKNWLE